MRLMLDNGLFSKAEQVVLDAAADPRNDRTALMLLLVPMYVDLGRAEEASPFIERRWEELEVLGEGDDEPAIKLLRQHLAVTLKPPLVDKVRRILDEAGKRVPEDDRIWLGRVNLALRMGDLDEARRWLDACLSKRPRDFAVWRARLEWAMAAGRIEIVEEAVKDPRLKDTPPALRHRLRAWSARHHGDLTSERLELERLTSIVPGELKAVERLSEIAKELGQLELSTELLRKKAIIAERQDRYMKLYERKQPLRDAESMAQLAEQLGKTFEARGFQTIAAAQSPFLVGRSQKLLRNDTHQASVVENGK